MFKPNVSGIFNYLNGNYDHKLKGPERSEVYIPIYCVTSCYFEAHAIYVAIQIDTSLCDLCDHFYM